MKRYYGLWTIILARSDSNVKIMNVFITNTHLFASQDTN